MPIENLFDKIKSFVLKPIWDSFTILHLIILLAVVLVIWIIVQRLILTQKDANARKFVEARCATCGWSGRVSIQIRRCPQCNSLKINHFNK